MISYCLSYKFERQVCWCSCDLVSSPLILVVKVLLNYEFWKQQYWGDKKNNIHEQWNYETKYFRSS